MNLSKSDCQISDFSTVVTVSDQVSSDLGGEAVILNMKTGVYHGLNEVGAKIWDLMEQPKTVKEIHNLLVEEYEVEPEVCKNDLLSLLKNLQAVGLIEVKNETAA
ncbi:MAG: PqqD family peptide modification chaperone [Cyanobacteria bacterium J06632_19]